MKAGIDYEQRHVWSILRDIVDLDQNPKLHYSTPLHDTALHQTRMGVREVLAKGTEGINDFDGLGFTALHWSILREELPQIKALLKAGADVNLPTMVQKWSGLHLACMRSSFEISSALLGTGTKLEQEDFKGRTPLHYIPIRDAALVELLLKNGADAKHVDYHDNTALHTMAWNKPPYLPRDRRPDAPRDGVSTINMFISHGIGMDVRNARGETPTMLMAMRNTSLFGLPDAPAVMSYKEMCPGSGWNIMHYAAYYWDAHSLLQLNFHEATIFFGPPEFDPDATDAQGRTPLEAFEYRMFAAEEERTAGVFRPTREEVRLFVELLQDCRTSNWNEGCYLETKQQLLEDGSLEKMEAWRRQQKEQRRPSDRTSLWEATDVWWRDMAQQEASEWQ